jgi:hypothetical protein
MIWHAMCQQGVTTNNQLHDSWFITLISIKLHLLIGQMCS